MDMTALCAYAREAAQYATNNALPFYEFALNHYGKPDVALFDFTSVYAADNASRVSHILIAIVLLLFNKHSLDWYEKISGTHNKCYLED